MMRKIIFITAMLLVSPLAFAGNGSGYITNITTHVDVSNGTNPDLHNVVMFNVENHTNAPACSSNEWAFVIDTDVGKAMYSLLLTAAAQHKPVTVLGLNDCAAWPDRERPYMVQLVFQ